MNLTRMSDGVQGLGHRQVTRGADPEEVRNLAEDDVHPDAGQEAQHHRVGHEPHEPADSENRAAYEDEAGDDRQQDRRAGTLVGRDRRESRPSGEGGSTRGRDDHQLAAGSEPPGYGTCEAGVETVHGADSREHTSGHAVRDAADRTR